MRRNCVRVGERRSRQEEQRSKVPQSRPGTGRLQVQQGLPDLAKEFRFCIGALGSQGRALSKGSPAQIWVQEKPLQSPWANVEREILEAVRVLQVSDPGARTMQEIPGAEAAAWESDQRQHGTGGPGRESQAQGLASCSQVVVSSSGKGS